MKRVRDEDLYDPDATACSETAIPNKGNQFAEFVAQAVAQIRRRQRHPGDAHHLGAVR
jgi:hypothetical protein